MALLWVLFFSLFNLQQREAHSFESRFTTAQSTLYVGVILTRR